MTLPNLYSNLDQTTTTQEELAQIKGHRFFIRTLIFTAIGSVLAALIVVTAFWLYPAHQAIAFFESLSTPLVFWRLLLFMVLIGGWPFWTRWYSQWGYLNTEQSDRLLGLRWRLAGWLIIGELLLTQNILGHFMDQLL
jgi:hypothetical protein